MTEFVSASYRLPPDVGVGLAERAARERRSINSLVVQALREFLAPVAGEGDDLVSRVALVERDVARLRLATKALGIELNV